MIQQIRVLLYLISNHVQNCVNEMKSNDKLFALLKIFMANLSLLLISLKSLRYHKTTHKKTTLKYFLSNPMFTKHLWMGYSCSDIIILLSIYFFLLTQSHSPERRNNTTTQWIPHVEIAVQFTVWYKPLWYQITKWQTRR